MEVRKQFHSHASATFRVTHLQSKQVTTDTDLCPSDERSGLETWHRMTVYRPPPIPTPRIHEDTQAPEEWPQKGAEVHPSGWRESPGRP
jgi:hypothetical protein